MAMIALVLGLLLLQAAPQGTGFVTGVVRGGTGSPAARVRVYAITYRDAVEAATLPPALESLTETDESGRYRLELRPGRYNIATGSVAVPTYYPGTSDISAARVITVARDLVVPDIDFGTFIPASRNVNGVVLRPTGNGVLSGVLRYPDGTPASGITVVATPVSGTTSGVSIITTTTGGIQTINTTAIGTILNNAAAQLVQSVAMIFTQGGAPAVTDASGAYQIQNLGPDAYHIVAGYAEAPAFYPGVPDVATAKPVVVVLNSKIDKLDFTVRRWSGVTVSGVVSTTSGVPATGATVRIRNRDNPSAAAGFGLPIRSAPQTTNVSADGSFSFSDVQPGTLFVDVSLAGIPNQRREVVVSGQQPGGLEVVLPVTMITGQILMEDGSPVPNPEAFRDVVLSPVRNPKILPSTILPISGTGAFSRLMEVDRFSFHVRALPEEYEIKSVKAGTVDLLKETLEISGKELVHIEMRVARRGSVSGAGRVSGTIRDSITGAPVAGRITLCCVDSGIAEEHSAPLRADGSFEFSALPPGEYTPSLELPAGVSGLYFVASGIDVGTQGLHGVTFFTAARFGQITATIRSDDPLPENVLSSIVFVNPVSGLRVIADRNPSGTYVAEVPLGARYDVLVENLPQGYAVKSGLGSLEPNSANPVVIVIQRTP